MNVLLLFCRMADCQVVFFDIMVQKQITKRGKKVLVSKEEIAVGVAGSVVGAGTIWWAEQHRLRQQGGLYNMLHILGSKDPWLDPRPATGFLMELPLQCVCEDTIPSDVLRLAKIKISQEQWDVAKAVSHGLTLPFLFSNVFYLN
jgi:hypothetical protein